MPPIRKADGTAVDPKGISQIRTGDGRILFEGDAIPDSALLHFPFDERDNSTLVELLEGADGTAEGTTNVSNDWWQGFAEDGDGTDDYCDLGNWSEVNFGERLNDDWGVALTVETTNSDEAVGGMRVSDIAFSLWTGFVVSSDKFGFRLHDRDDNDNDQVFETDSDVTDGQKHRIMIGADGPEADDKVIFFDANDETNIVTDDGDHGDFPEPLPESFITHARNRGGSQDSHIDAVIDNVIPLDEKPTESVAQTDYENQPWS